MQCSCTLLRGGADKSLARPGRTQATANRLGIYSTYSPRRSIHFLARCSDYWKPLKKIGKLSIQPGLHELCVGRNMATFELFSSVQGTDGSPTGPDPENRAVIKTLEAQVVQFLLGCMCPVSRDSVVQEQYFLGDIPAAFFLQKSFNCTRRDNQYSALIVWPFGRQLIRRMPS